MNRLSQTKYHAYLRHFDAVSGSSAPKPGNTSNPGVLYDGVYMFEPWTVRGPCSKGTREYNAYDANQWAACCNAYGEGVTYVSGGTCT